MPEQSMPEPKQGQSDISQRLEGLPKQPGSDEITDRLAAAEAAGKNGMERLFEEAQDSGPVFEPDQTVSVLDSDNRYQHGWRVRGTGPVIAGQPQEVHLQYGDGKEAQTKTVSAADLALWQAALKQPPQSSSAEISQRLNQ